MLTCGLNASHCDVVEAVHKFVWDLPLWCLWKAALALKVTWIHPGTPTGFTPGSKHLEHEL